MSHKLLEAPSQRPRSRLALFQSRSSLQYRLNTRSLSIFLTTSTKEQVLFRGIKYYNQRVFHVNKVLTVYLYLGPSSCLPTTWLHRPTPADLQPASVRSTTTAVHHPTAAIHPRPSELQHHATYFWYVRTDWK